MLLRDISFVAVFCFPLLSFSQNDSGNAENKIYYFENGFKSSEGPLENGKPNGYWRSYYRNGELKAEGNRENFLLDSLWIFYDRDGIATVDIEYKYGLKDGLRRSYELGKIVKEEPFLADKLEGLTRIFYPNGYLAKEIPFVQGSESGTGFEYAADDKRIITVLTYKNATLIRQQSINRWDLQKQKQGLWVVFHKNRGIQVEGPYQNDLKNGYWKFYQTNGNLIRIEKWINGELQEGAEEVAKVEIKRTINQKTGRVNSKGAYQNGKPTGVHRKYNDDGEVVSSILYDQGEKLAEGIVDELGRKQGPWIFYYGDPKIKAEGSFKDDLKVDKWRYYFEDTKLEQEGNYNAGAAYGEWNWYFKNGEVRRTEEYFNGLEEGQSREYNDTGVVIAQGEYVEGLKEGPWSLQINDHMEEGTYFEGLKTGLWRHYYLLDKVLSFEGSYENDKENGEHSYYFDDGRLKRRGQYLFGDREGVWEFFNKDGSRTLTIEYERGKEVKYNGKKIDYGRRYNKAVEAEEKVKKSNEE
jgi:antitoxin component YwqK of YwqJK toxin-antitoxin module